MWPPRFARRSAADVLAGGPDVEDAGRGVRPAARLAAPGEDLVVRRDESVVAFAEFDRDAQRVGKVGLGDVGGRRLAGASPGLDAAVEDVHAVAAGSRRGGAASSRGSPGGSGRRRRRARPGPPPLPASVEGSPRPARASEPATPARHRRSRARCRAGPVPCGGRCRSRPRCGACCRRAGPARHGRCGRPGPRGAPPATRRRRAGRARRRATPSRRSASWRPWLPPLQVDSGCVGGSTSSTHAACTPRNSRIARMIPSIWIGVSSNPRLRTNSGAQRDAP